MRGLHRSHLRSTRLPFRRMAMNHPLWWLVTSHLNASADQSASHSAASMTNTVSRRSEIETGHVALPDEANRSDEFHGAALVVRVKVVQHEAELRCRECPTGNRIWPNYLGVLSVM